MKQHEFNSRFRHHVREKLSPSQAEKDLVGKLYTTFQSVLGINNCIQIGSYPRFTATRPIHDLDILYFAGRYHPHGGVNPHHILESLKHTIQTTFKNPTRYQYDVSLQTHSVTVTFTENGKEVFAIDIVPAYISGEKNEFGDDTYWVSELLNIGHSKRKAYYETHLRDHLSIGWLKSDPRGYISVAQKVNEENTDFRKSVKFVKAWKFGCKGLQDNFALKSFHIEQVLTRYFIETKYLDVFSAVFKFFSDLEKIISFPQIQDRAGSGRYIDEYVKEFDNSQKQKILEARDYLMKRLEGFTGLSSIPQLLGGGFYTRKSKLEQFLFDYGIPIFIDAQHEFVIDGYVLNQDGFRGGYWLSANGDKVPVGRNIRFKVNKNTTGAPLCKWKVKNSDDSKEPRGEINDHTTKYSPESTAFRGNHYVECYAIKDGACIARHKRNVIIF